MNSNDNETLLSRLISSAASLIKPKTQTRMQCVDCGEWKMKGDSSPCGSHPPLPDPSEDTLLIKIGFVKPKPALPEPPTVERLGRSSDGRQVSRFKDPTKPDPLELPPGGPNLSDQATDSQKGLQEGDEDIWAEVRNKTKYRRKEDNSAEWSMTSEELNRAQDRAEGYDDDEPETPDVPKYTM